MRASYTLRGLLGLAAALVSSVVLDGHAASATPGLPPSGRSAGPRDVLPSPSWGVAPTFEALEGMVADPGGPKDIALLPMIYRGDLTIRRPLSIHGRKGAVLEGSGSKTVVTIAASDVLVEDVVVRGSGRRHTAEDAGFRATGERVRIANARVEETLFGVSLLECKRCVVEDVHVLGWGDEAELRGDGIKLWESDDSVVRGCLVERSRDVVVWYTKRATLDGNEVRASRYGAHFMYAHDGAVRRSRFMNNVVGVFVMYSARLEVTGNVVAGARGAAGMGLGLKDSDGVRVSGNWLVANTTGTYLDNTPRTAAQPVTFERNRFALNAVALGLHSPGKGLSFHGNDFGQNTAMVEVDGGGDALGVEMRGNHYTDYEGYDLDGDGVGDVAYEVKALSSQLTETRPALKFFRGTAAMGVIDAVARAVPVFASRKVLVDPAPLSREPDFVASQQRAP